LTLNEIPIIVERTIALSIPRYGDRGRTPRPYGTNLVAVPKFVKDLDDMPVYEVDERQGKP
jgi:hypothetical protein